MEPDRPLMLTHPTRHPWPAPVLRELRKLLDDAGYEVSFRVAGWTECFARLHTERWLGSGVDEDDALANVLDQMLPSRLGRDLVASKVAAVLSVVDCAAPVATEETSAAPASTPAEPTAPPASAAALGVVTADSAAMGAPLASAPPPVAAPPPAALHQPAPLPMAPASSRPERRAVDGVAALDGLNAEIEARANECARLAPARLRAVLLVWICRARAAQEAHPADLAVEWKAGQIARRLSDVAKRFWPGSVLALQLATRPEHTGSVRPGDAPPRTWAAAEAAARWRLDEQRDRDLAAGFDEDGWADAAFRTPAPARPDELLQQVETELERFGETAPLAEAEVKTLEGIARTLRWIRGAVHDPTAWGTAMGRMRRLVARGTEREVGPLRRLLDARHRPSAPWSTPPRVECGPSASEAARAPSEDDLRAELPAVTGDRERLLAWLLRALDRLSTPELAVLVAPHRQQVISVCEMSAQHEDRRVRRRLRDLLARLTDEGAPPSADVPTSTARDRTATAAAAEADTEPSLGPEGDALLVRVRPLTEGRRVLFVSNRLDAELEAKLTVLLGVQITGCDGSLRRVQAQCARIGAGAYEIVLSATGFQLHGTDMALARASKAARVPYVRVDRGRPLACVQAIARELGVNGTSSGAASVAAIVGR